MIEKDIEEFGKSLGVDNVQFGNAETLKFAVESKGDVYIRKLDAYHTMFYILKRFETGFPDFYWEALKMGYPQETYSFLTHSIAFQDDHIGFAVRLHNERCDLPTINQIFKFLLGLMKKLENNVEALN